MLRILKSFFPNFDHTGSNLESNSIVSDGKIHLKDGCTYSDQVVVSEMKWPHSFQFAERRSLFRQALLLSFVTFAVRKSKEKNIMVAFRFFKRR